MAKITEFTTEHEINPIGLDNTSPRFGWKYERENNLLQKSYVIKVSSSLEKLLNNEGDMWDSGEVVSGDNFCVVYDGKKLNACSVYYVKVWVKTSVGNAESEINTFETGLFEELWQPSFRILPYSANGAAIAFRRDFTLPAKKVERARAYVCALGNHEFYINGHKIGNDLLNPVISDYNKLYYYNTYDITEYVQEKNGAGIIAANGWNGFSQICAVFYVKFTDGEEVFVKTGEYERAWKAKKSPVIFTSVFDGETYDARLEESLGDWSEYNPRFNLNNGWFYAAVKLHDANVSIRPQRMESIKLQEALMPVKVFQNDDETVYDFGEILTGRCKITVNGERGARVTIKHAEVLNEDCVPDYKSMRNALNTDVYILAGKESETWNPTFSYRGFRYASVSVSGKVRIENIVAEKIRTDTRVNGSFVCSDGTLNALHETAFRTEACNHHGILTDCPQRDERMGWLNDMSTRLYQTVNNFDMTRFFEKITDDITATMNSDGAIKDTAPYYIGGEIADPVSISYLLIAKFSYELYGNKKLLENNYNNYKKWVEYLTAASENGILSLGLYGDWVPAIRVVTGEARKNRAVPIPVISTAYLYWYYKLMSEFSELLGKEDDLNRYRELAARTKTAFNERFYNDETASYCADVQSMNAIAVSIGLCEEENRQKLVDAIVNDVKGRDYHMTCGNQSYRHLFKVLAENGHNDVVMRILKNEEYPSFGYMLKNGATTIWERWEKEVSKVEENMHSYCHPMFTAYDEWFFRYVAGIKVLDGVAGMKRMEISPACVDGLTKFSCIYRTPNGILSVKYEKVSDGKLNYSVTVPPNTTARIKLPFESRIVDVGSGDYGFTVNG